MEQIRFLSVDIETFSSVDLGKSGVYRYVESKDFEILLFGYSVNGSPVRVVDLACGEKLPEEIRKAISDPTVMKWAFNAQFERICLSRFLGMPTGEYLDPVSWHCTMIWSATLGLPMSLAGLVQFLVWKAETDRRERSHPVLLRSMQSYQGERWQDTEPAGA